MMRCLKAALIAAMTAAQLAPAAAMAKQTSGKRHLRIVVHPKYPARQHGPYGFLPGYRQPPYIAEWRDRSPRYGGGDDDNDLHYWSDGEWRYGWGGPGFYRGRWNGGTFGPCWTQTPIGPMWNCGR